MTDIGTFTPIPWIDLLSAVREVRRSTALSYEEAQKAVVSIVAEGAVKLRGFVKIKTDVGWLRYGSEFIAWTSEDSAKVRLIEADSIQWRNAEIDWVDGVVRFQEFTASAAELDTAQLKSWLRTMLYNEPAIGIKNVGRTESIDWKQMYFEMIRWASHPDGMPEDSKIVVKSMVEWVFKTFASPPDRKTIEDRVKEYFFYAAENRGNPFPAPR